MSGAEQRLCLYTAAELEPVLQRMTQQAARLFQPGRPLYVVGLLRRGEPLARKVPPYEAEFCIELRRR